MLAWIAPFLLSASEPSRTIRDEITGLAWSRSGALIATTPHRVYDLKSGRSSRLRRFADEFTDPFHRPLNTLKLNASRTKGIGRGFWLDLRTLASRPLRHPATWVGDRLVELQEVGFDQYAFVQGRKRIAKGWHVLGLSEDLRWATATHREPFENDRVFLLKLRLKTGQAKVLASYPNASDDHNWIDRIQRLGSAGKFVVHSDNLASGLMAPFFAGAKLNPIRLAVPKNLDQTSSSVEPIEGTGWAIFRRKFMLENGEVGMDIDTLDLWNMTTGKLVRIAKASDGWDGKSDQRRDGQALGAYAIDQERRRIAFVVSIRQQSKIFVRPLASDLHSP